jgi:predicted GNAT family acetyltransferase
MEITFSEDVDQFTDVAGDWLAKSPAENNVMLTAIENQRAGRAKGIRPATYAWVTNAGEILGALRWAPPMTARMTAMPESAARGLAAELAAREIPLPGISGPHECAAAFTARWEELTGQGPIRVRKLQMSQLDKVNFSEWPPGRMRPAEAGDVDLVAGWIATLFRDGGMLKPELAARQQVEEQFAGGRLYVWEDNGEPVAVVGHAAPVCGVVRLAGGFSPPEHRTSWYGVGLAAAVANGLFESGHLACIAITDESNPHASAALRMIGYRSLLLLSEYRYLDGADQAFPMP